MTEVGEVLPSGRIVVAVLGPHEVMSSERIGVPTETSALGRDPLIERRQSQERIDYMRRQQEAR